jgi:hypothetical protein
MGKTFSTGLLTNGIWQDSSNNIGIGAANSSYKFQVTGTTNLTGALTGTTATFSGSVTSDDVIFTAGTLFGTGNTGFSNRASDTTLYLQMPATGFNITDNALNTRFILSSAGAATFSSTITSQANGSTFGTASATGRAVIIQAGSTNQAIMFKNAAGGDGTLFINGTSTTMDYNFNTYSVADALVIKNSGNVGIGTSSPPKAFQVERSVDDWIGGFKNYGSNAYGLQVDLSGSTGATGGFALGVYSQTGTGFFVKNNGNVGIGTSSPTNPLTIVGSYRVGNSTNTRYYESGTDSSGCFLEAIGDTTNSRGIRLQAINDAQTSYTTIRVRGGDSAITMETVGSERMRITSGGYLKASVDGTYLSTGNYHELKTNTSGQETCIFTNSSTSNPFGITVYYNGSTISNTSNWFFNGDANGSLRVRLMSNGGIANYQSNNTNLSDIRTKKDIIPLESYWDKFKGIEMVKFKYVNQSHDDYNIGVIAQQVEEVAPEFVDVDGWGETPEDGIPLKSVYTADLHHATIKVLQEAMAKIEELEAKVSALENR